MTALCTLKGNGGQAFMSFSESCLLRETPAVTLRVKGLIKLNPNENGRGTDGKTADLGE